MTITNGTIEFTRRVTTGDYQHKDAKVSLTFTIDEGVDPEQFAAHVGRLAVERAMEMVGEKPASPFSAPSTADPAPSPAVSSAPINGNGVAANPPMMTHVGNAISTGVVGSPSLSPEISDQQMIDALNFIHARASMIAVPGNHEFDDRRPQMLANAITVATGPLP